ncbi:hypothetical protein [Streptomyces sp. TLI_171]|uniref:hypothetical protein n=1 Tax=Streptomyces sp. TLI_171 TaxID=1938859 RepID=UPI000C18DF60|nr:hypothetical protein [Streptomyces sp. TLI_171]RKE18273.1 hypothetical protein BX266_1557 [Streptomyces sp. TLI_171]
MPKVQAGEQKLALVSAARRAVLRLDESERPRLVVLGVSASSVWLGALLGGLAMLLLSRAYYLVVTDRSVFVLHGPRTAGEPRQVAAVVPLEQAAAMVQKTKLGTTWNSVWLRLPERRRPVRVKVSFHSRTELDRFLAKF